MTRIRITVGSIGLEAELTDSPAARAIAAALPITAKAQRWGQEIYFAIPVDAELEPAARQHVAVGDLGYWPPGKAFCIFFGPTPASHDDQPVAASPVNVVGKVLGDAKALVEVKSGVKVVIEAVG